MIQKKHISFHDYVVLIHAVYLLVFLLVCMLNVDGGVMHMNKTAFLSLDEAELIASQFGTPCHVYDEYEIRSRARELYNAFSWNNGFKEYFAVKATPNPAVLSILREEGCGVDCATGTELMLAHCCGFSGSEIMLSSNNTKLDDFMLASKFGALVNFDAPDMIDLWEDGIGSFPEKMVCRINPGGEFYSTNGIIGTPRDAKFGMTEQQLISTFSALRNKGVKSFGIHAFLASNALNYDYYPNLAKLLFGILVKIRNELGININLIDLSGGIGIPYLPEEQEIDIAKVGRDVESAYESVLTAAGYSDVSICTELGRWLLAPAGGLLTRVIHHKTTYHDYLGVDACAANLMRPAMYGAYHHITVLGKEDAPLDGCYSVVGCLCENNDQFAIDRQMPICETGDLLFIHDTGAHGYSMGYNYNGALRSAEVLRRENGTFQLIRRAETMKDYFATLDITTQGKQLMNTLDNELLGLS